MAKDKLHVKDRDIVVPGELLATGMGYLPSKGTFRRDDDIVAERVGLIQVDGKVIKLTPLAGAYLPKPGDVIVSEVVDILMSGWRVDTGSPYSAILPLAEGSNDYIRKGADLRRYFKIGDYMMCKITNVTSQNLIDVTVKGPGLRKLSGGRLIKVDPMKVPRIIGKKASMVQMIKEVTGCRVAVGQNGLVWISGTPKAELLAIQTIKEIEAKAHTQGLTDKMEKFLKAGAKKAKLPKPKPREEREDEDEDFEDERPQRRERSERRPRRDSRSGGRRTDRKRPVRGR